jgi:predicted nucleic acid-binding protein
MANGVLVDTCIWIDFFKDTPSIAKKLHRLIEKDTVYTAGIILFEIFQGLKSEKEKAVLEEVFKSIPYLEMTSSSWLNAAGLSRDLKKKGVTLPPSDILLAQLAIENSLEIFTIDDHFKSIPGVKLIKN